MKHLAVVPARSGSKGLPDKNIKLLCNKPLMAYSIEAAFQSGVFDVVHVSTDSEAYAEIARQHGADIPFLRSAETASDTASSWAVILEVLDQYAQIGKQFDTITLLQPTSPLRTAEDICKALDLMMEKNATAVASVCEVDHSPLWCGTLQKNNCMDGFLHPNTNNRPRQTLETYYRLNGAIYVLDVSRLQKYGRLIYDADTYAYIMPQEHSVDIDTELDLAIAETIMRYSTPG